MKRKSEKEEAVPERDSVPTVVAQPVASSAPAAQPEPLIFLFHWNEAEAVAMAAELSTLGFGVEFEHESADRGSARVAELCETEEHPHALLISLRRLPAQGLSTAKLILQNEHCGDLRLILLDCPAGSREYFRMELERARLIDWDEVAAELQSLDSGSG
jgi:hypothetical protein